MEHIAVLVHLLIVIPTTIRILLRDDISAPARLAWFMVIVLFPYFGAAIYFLFGEARFGVAIQKARTNTLLRTLQEGKEWLGRKEDIARLLSPAAEPLAYSATSVDSMCPVPDNAVTLLTDEASAIDNIIADINAATHSVNILYYIWEDDETGRRVADAIIAAGKRGVTCRVMADGLGSRPLIKSALWKQLSTAEGVTAQVALSLKHLIRTALFSRIDLRNHRKITVIDNRITYCGSQNCADKAFHRKPKYAPWIDIMYRVTGPVVAQNQLLFASDWLYYHPNDDLESFFAPAPEEVADGITAQVVGFGPINRSGASSQLLTTLISNARKNIIITTPYFVPDTEIMSSLTGAAERGVEITMVFPAKNDSWVVAAASRSHYHNLLRAGISIYEFTPGLLHAKTLTVDGEVTFVGSTNLDLRSFDLNYENNIIFYDQTITEETRERQRSYLHESHAVTLAEVDKWSIPKRLWYNAVATVGPIL